jgi:hypothetical protein
VAKCHDLEKLTCRNSVTMSENCVVWNECIPRSQFTFSSWRRDRLRINGVKLPKILVLLSLFVSQWEYNVFSITNANISANGQR